MARATPVKAPETLQKDKLVNFYLEHGILLHDHPSAYSEARNRMEKVVFDGLKEDFRLLTLGATDEYSRVNLEFRERRNPQITIRCGLLDSIVGIANCDEFTKKAVAEFVEAARKSIKPRGDVSKHLDKIKTGYIGSAWEFILAYASDESIIATYNIVKSPIIEPEEQVRGAISSVIDSAYSEFGINTGNAPASI